MNTFNVEIRYTSVDTTDGAPFPFWRAITTCDGKVIDDATAQDFDVLMSSVGGRLTTRVDAPPPRAAQPSPVGSRAAREVLA